MLDTRTVEIIAQVVYKEKCTDRRNGLTEDEFWAAIRADTIQLATAIQEAAAFLSPSLPPVPKPAFVPPAPPFLQPTAPFANGPANNLCKDCGSQMEPGKNGKPYCKPCYKAWAAINKPRQ